jgi:hypothetical protein
MASSVEMIRRVAAGLGPMIDEVVFVGGTAGTLLVTDPAAPTIRETLDVDVIVEVVGQTAFYSMEKTLRGKGFQNQGEMICRWKYEDLLVDIMPTDAATLGFSNRWYPEAFRTAIPFDVGDLQIRLITGPLFLATKLEAYHGRGKGDIFGSHDMEDIIAVIDGRVELMDEMADTPESVRAYLSDEFAGLLGDQAFLTNAPWHLGGDRASQQRWPRALDILQAMVDNG